MGMLGHVEKLNEERITMVASKTKMQISKNTEKKKCKDVVEEILAAQGPGPLGDLRMKGSSKKANWRGVGPLARLTG